MDIVDQFEPKWIPWNTALSLSLSLDTPLEELTWHCTVDLPVMALSLSDGCFMHRLISLQSSSLAVYLRRD